MEALLHMKEVVEKELHFAISSGDTQKARDLANHLAELELKLKDLSAASRNNGRRGEDGLVEELIQDLEITEEGGYRSTYNAKFATRQTQDDFDMLVKQLSEDKRNTMNQNDLSPEMEPQTNEEDEELAFEQFLIDLERRTEANESKERVKDEEIKAFKEAMAKPTTNTTAPSSQMNYTNTRDRASTSPNIYSDSPQPQPLSSSSPNAYSNPNSPSYIGPYTPRTKMQSGPVNPQDIYFERKWKVKAGEKNIYRSQDDIANYYVNLKKKFPAQKIPEPTDAQLRAQRSQTMPYETKRNSQSDKRNSQSENPLQRMKENGKSFIQIAQRTITKTKSFTENLEKKKKMREWERKYYADENNRLKSFTESEIKWPHPSPTVEKCAKAGFFFKPRHPDRPDRCKCFACRLSIGNWEPTDDPKAQHRTWSPNCPFVLTWGHASLPEAQTRKDQASFFRALSAKAIKLMPAKQSSSSPPSPHAQNKSEEDLKETVDFF